MTRLNGGKLRWSAITSHRPLTPLDVPSESVALARLHAPGGTMLVAASVLPWRGGGRFWAGRAEATDREWFEEALAEHVTTIRRARQPSEPVIWGGDFNQTLDGPETGCTAGGRESLVDAFGALGLVAVTRHQPHAVEGLSSIDHLALPTSWTTRVSAQMPIDGAHKPLSDHALYVGDVGPLRPDRLLR